MSASADALAQLQAAGVPLVVRVRVPGWSSKPTIQVSSVEATTGCSLADEAAGSCSTGAPTPVTPGTLAKVSLWQPSTGRIRGSRGQVDAGVTGALSWIVSLQTNPQVAVERSYNEAATVSRGPIVYALSIGQHYEALHHYYMQSYDYAVHPTTPWNLALVLASDSNPGSDLNFVRTADHPGHLPYSNANHTQYIEAHGRLLPDWVTALNSAAAPPPSPVCGG